MINTSMEHNKYYHWYISIIQKAISEQRKKQRYIHETHHIIPRSMGGSNDNSNTVVLTHKEHFVCHHLLTKFTENVDRSKMIFAFWNMINKWGRKHTDYKINSRTYAQLREEVAQLISKNNKGKSYPVTDKTKKLQSEMKMGSKNPMYGKVASNRGMSRPGIGGRKKGTTWTDAERRSHETTRSQPGYYDYLKDPRRGEKISKSQKGRIGTSAGKTWFNNGIVETYANECPEGFVLGRLYREQTGKRGMKWFNNGIVNKQFKDNEVQEGFVRGRISKK